MKCFLACLFTAVYVLIAVRVAFIGCQIEANSGRKNYAFAIYGAAAWPALMVVVGFGTIVFGDPGIYAPNWKYNR